MFLTTLANLIWKNQKPLHVKMSNSSFAWHQNIRNRPSELLEKRQIAERVAGYSKE